MWELVHSVSDDDVTAMEKEVMLLFHGRESLCAALLIEVSILLNTACNVASSWFRTGGGNGSVG